MQFFKLFLFTLEFIWRTVVGGEDKPQVQYEILLRMIEDRDFDDSLVKKEFLHFCQLDKTGWRINRLLDNIGEVIPRLLQHLGSLFDRS